MGTPEPNNSRDVELAEKVRQLRADIDDQTEKLRKAKEHDSRLRSEGDSERPRDGRSFCK